jgi:serine protease Do
MPDFRFDDLSVLKTLPLKGELQTFPVPLDLDLDLDLPQIGDQVVAIGFPQIDTVNGEPDQVVTRLAEGMFASYGRITALHSSGRSETNKTPVFEVDTHWPSGMCGGPVLDALGRVIGVVSSSLEGTDAQRDVSWATWIGQLGGFKSVLREIIG